MLEEIGLPRLRMTWDILQDLSRAAAVSRFPRGPVAGNHSFISTSSMQLGQVRFGSKKTFFSMLSGFVTQLDRKNADGDFLQHELLEKRETALNRSRGKLQVILRRGRPISNIFGANAHANVLKGTFSTDCKSNCRRIGLSVQYLSLIHI